MASSFDQWTTFLLPARYAQGDAEQVRIGRVTLFLSLLVFLAGWVYSAVYLSLGMTFAATGPAQAILFVPVAVWIFRRSQSVVLAGNVLACTCTVGVGIVVVGTGGVTSPALPWFFFGPLLAMVIAGRVSGVSWYLVVLATIIAFLVAGDAIVLASFQVPTALAEIHCAVVAIGLITVITSTVWSFGLTQEIATKKLQMATDVIEAACHQAESEHANALLVLDNVTDGLAIVNLDGTLVGHPSARFQEWFGCPPPAATLWQWFRCWHESFSEDLELNWEQLSSDWMPLELAIDQLPNEFDVEGRHFSLMFRPVMEGEQLQHLLVICTDTTAEREAKHANEIQQEQLAIFTRFVRDPKSLRDFLSEADRLVAKLTDSHEDQKRPAQLAEQRRWVHTLKGNCAIFGLNTFAHWLHRLEDELIDELQGLTAIQRDAISTQWTAIRARLASIVDIEDSDQMTIEKDVFEATVMAVESGYGGPVLATSMKRWGWDRVDRRVELLAERATNFAQRLGKSGLRVDVDVQDVRRPPCPDWNAFWGAVIHVVRNAIDHGIEAPHHRVERGKEASGRLSLRAWESEDTFHFEISDDGAGIDWDKVSQKCRALGLTCDSPGALHLAIFADGMSTKDEVSETSGRGVGMAAVREACEILGGTIEIESKSGMGTTFQFQFPMFKSGASLLSFQI
ncbi:ATP-binding protein [Rhodopirellula sp. MGV]|uniref:ATP-binding protein n=1 Tax=Rhodopirellula sp. MGV TaxID=2023130 RepID=UPI000B973F44|nr:ATP-binding protein [Rhodopirellula sp. MGV]OYP38232.1 hypothetical protein CGZ80_03165 [Rhodopirellula sp. MGV]PNY38568.1 hypothetical protein C2E31_01215 [Rhodopirellula baltica]